MFGNNLTSSWANPPQNQQPQQNTSAFGQTGAFGTAAGAFGQNQQPPQANPMFGNLTSNPNPGTSTGAFGAFGPANNTANQSGSLFGAAKPATGFGAFGGGTTSTFGSGVGAFGQNANTTQPTTGPGLFGQPASTGAFGSTTTGTSLFNKPGSTFGSTTSTSLTGPSDGVAPVTTGSSNPPYSAWGEKDAANSTLTLQYQSISCIPQYRGSSFEEIRLQDYAQGRKTAGAFGQSATFGTTSGTTNIFGGATQGSSQPTNSIFGSATNANTANTSTFGAFGQANPQANPQPAASNNTGIFGAFGQQQQPQQPQQPTGFGAFGQTQNAQPAQTGTNIFGSANAFNANKPGAFGAFGATGGNTFGGTSAFGAQTQPGQQPAAAGTNIFGQPQQQGNAFGAFGANANKPSIFGTQPAAQAPNAFSAFGQPQAAQQTQPQGGLFGGSAFNQQPQPQPQQPNQQPAGGLFGNPQPAQSGLFGGTGLFGNNAQQPNAQQGQQQNSFTNLFNKPAAANTGASGLFGSFGQAANANTGQQPSLFGQPNANTQPGTGGYDLFGRPMASTLGQSQSNIGQPGGGALGAFGQTGSLNVSANVPGAQGSLTASISQPIGANLPIFSMLPPGPQAVTLDQQQPKKKAGFFVDIPTRSPVPRLQLSYTPANTKLRGFGSSLTASNLGGVGMGSSTTNGLQFSSGKPNALSLSRAIDNRGPIGPDALLGRSSSPSLGSGGRQSVKKLILDKKVDASEFLGKSVSASPQRTTGTVSFSPALSVAARQKEATDSLRPIEEPAPSTKAPRPLNRFTAQSTHQDTSNQNPATAKKPTAKDGEPQEGDYWVKPDLATLKNVGYEELLSFKGLAVGRLGYGEIEFLDPVDLTGLPKLGALLGEVVRFDDKECSVYREVDEVDKPPPGTGLNVRARISLVRCWAQDKATREAIKDETNPMAIRHLKRLKGMKDTHFENWDGEEGKWTFTVDHF